MATNQSSGKDQSSANKSSGRGSSSDDRGSGNKSKSSSGSTRGGTSEQHSQAGKQSHKND